MQIFPSKKFVVTQMDWLSIQVFTSPYTLADIYFRQICVIQDRSKDIEHRTNNVGLAPYHYSRGTRSF
ncbi:hypothetical protein Pcinc_015083 [Petrolisthes cinctipes]|uniref:Uncharacterized protein n=1 Tax=Petrolisthes cinctipes TaxID=88211 RepID=A0AAE1FVL2_PETCI|nr:hypothetical protein Pcinc_015083 [Petrolisthes cinctipes]